ncbi:hypothetical protein KIH87_13450 [Paraneptunicella aestuarii]|uniref:hypothetical protein n=1 Tax=Paraneptunicella aestuarii TaxID=2831148 RepID=UPI001E2EC04F|nr:hypothetical protein [Paraneptunicella aestuarii]UAA37708.1 hypothetical protein KIH87_13450 [Paraneptunicella aestuarii]
MSELNYIQWVGGNKTDTFKDGAIQVEHIYRPEAYEGTVPGTIVHTVKVTNIGGNNVMLKDVQMVVDLDDTGTRWDAYLADISANPIDPLGETLNFGDIAPGSSSSQTYRWAARSLIPNVEEAFDITFNLIPVYQVVYSKSDAFVSKCHVSE